MPPPVEICLHGFARAAVNILARRTNDTMQRTVREQYTHVLKKENAARASRAVRMLNEAWQVFQSNQP